MASRWVPRVRLAAHVLSVVAALGFSVRVEAESPGPKSASPASPAGPATPRPTAVTPAPAGPAAQVRPQPDGAATLPWAWSLPGRRGWGLAGTGPAGIPLGDNIAVIKDREPWRLVGDKGAELRKLAAPARVLQSGQVGPFSENVAIVDNWIVALGAIDGSRVALVDLTAGKTVPGPAHPKTMSSLIGAARAGSVMVVWLRVNKDATQVLAVDLATGALRWRTDGGMWDYSATIAAGDQIIGLGTTSKVTALRVSDGTSLGSWPLKRLPAEWAPLIAPPLAVVAGELLVGDAAGVRVLETATGGERQLPSGLPAALPIALTVQARRVFGTWGHALIGMELPSGRVLFRVRISGVSQLSAAGETLLLCDPDGGASVLDAKTGAAQLRLGVGGCGRVVWRRDGSLAIGGSDRTWRLAPAGTQPPSAMVEREVTGAVTLDGQPAANLPVLLGVEGVPLDGVDGCPPLPPYGACVVSDAAGNFHARVRALGLLPVMVDSDAAARRAHKPRASSGAVRVDLTAPPAPLRLTAEGREQEL